MLLCGLPVCEAPERGLCINLRHTVAASSILLLSPPLVCGVPYACIFCVCQQSSLVLHRVTVLGSERASIASKQAQLQGPSTCAVMVCVCVLYMSSLCVSARVLRFDQ